MILVLISVGSFLFSVKFFWNFLFGISPFLFFLFILVCLPLEGTTLHSPRGKWKDQWACSLAPDFDS